MIVPESTQIEGLEAVHFASAKVVDMDGTGVKGVTVRALHAATGAVLDEKVTEDDGTVTLNTYDQDSVRIVPAAPEGYVSNPEERINVGSRLQPESTAVVPGTTMPFPVGPELAAPVYFTLMTEGQATTRGILRVVVPIAVAGAALGLAWFLFRPKK